MKLKLDGGLSQNEANRRDREGGGGVKKCAEEKGGVAYGTITRALSDFPTAAGGRTF